MTKNPILDELYAAREQLLADAGGDVSRYLAGVRERERASGRLLTAEQLEELRSARAARREAVGGASESAVRRTCS